MWTWFDIEKTAAVYVADGEPSVFCGVSLDPLASWLAEGNEPKPYTPSAEL